MASRLFLATCSLLAASLGASDGALAQAAPAQGGEITVTGRREALTTMLKNVLTESSNGQIGRFEESVCPGVAGLPENYASVVVGLIRANAKEAGLTLEEEGCAPESIAVFVPEPRALVKGWKDKDAGLFGSMTDKEVAALTRRDYPIVSWRVVQTMAWDGTEPERVSSIGGVPTSGEGALVIRNARATRNTENVRQDIRLALAVIDSDEIAGKSLQQLADIATLHLFLDVAPDAGEKATSDSMLSLFAKRPSGVPLPARLSAADRGMLAGLYESRVNNLSGERQRSRMVREIREEAKPKD